MLSDEEKRMIEEEVRGLPERSGCSVEALKIVQQQRGWVSDETLTDVARFLDMTPDELDAIATFYPFIFRRPVGRHVIYVCDSMVCWAMGFESVLDAIVQHLRIGMGGTTEDERFTLLPASCIGACDGAPALIIDDDLYRDVRPDSIESILKRYT